MTGPVSAPSVPYVATGVVIPLRSLRTGKLRLSSVLDDAERGELIRRMAETVVRAAVDLPVVIVYDDPEVADWARSLGADAIRGREPGLNPAVTQGRDLLRHRGFARAVIAHADLPRAVDLRPIADFDGITLVPDRIGDGTNVLCVPTRTPFRFSYGPGSFETHRVLAEHSGLPWRVLDDPDLAWDVDHPDDLVQGDPVPGGRELDGPPVGRREAR